MERVLKIAFVLAVLVGLSGCAKGLTNFGKGLTGQYCLETVWVYDENADSFDEVCTDDLDD